jgi:1-acyl-sn-glycerol-3-phosphate acyltransferase
MLKTIVAIIRFFWYLILSTPLIRKTKKLDKKGLIAERDAIVVPQVIRWGKFVVGLSGAQVTVSGEEHIPADTSVVFIGNHQGNFDIPLLLGYINKPKAFISKIEILKVPMLSDWMKLMQCTFLNRKDMRQSVKAMAEAVETVKRGYSLVIFPEGTRSKGGPVAEFKAGSFKLPLKAGVPIVPITIDGSWRLFEETGKMKKGEVHITIHPPVPTANLSKEEAAALPEKVRTIVMSALRTPPRII